MVQLVVQEVLLEARTLWLVFSVVQAVQAVQAVLVVQLVVQLVVLEVLVLCWEVLRKRKDGLVCIGFLEAVEPVVPPRQCRVGAMQKCFKILNVKIERNEHTERFHDSCQCSFIEFLR